MTSLTVVNLFAGHGTWLKPFREAGHKTWASDLVDRPGIDKVADILDLRPSDFPDWAYDCDLLLASPDCQAFSVGSIGTHWGGGNRGYIPLTEKAYNRMALVLKTKTIIELLKPKNFVIENPRGMLRKLGLLSEYERRTVWYCHYGDERAKPTDLWGGFPEGLVLSPECHNNRGRHEPDCCCADHARARRGAKAGTQGRDKDARSFIPFELAADVMAATVDSLSTSK